MIKFYFLTFLSFCYLQNVIAQEEDDNDMVPSFESIEDGLQRPKLIYKLALLSQFDFNSPSLQFGLEVKLNDRIGLHQELGYVNNWLNPLYTLIDHEVSKWHKIKNGFKYIIEPRFYLFPNDKLFSSRLFLATALDFRYVHIQRKEWVTRDLSYQQNLLYNVQRLEYGFNLKFGMTTSIQKLMPIEMVVGLGVRYVVLENDLPSNVQIARGRNNFLIARPAISGDFWFPSAYLGILLQLPFKK